MIPAQAMLLSTGGGLLVRGLRYLLTGTGAGDESLPYHCPEAHARCTWEAVSSSGAGPALKLCPGLCHENGNAFLYLRWVWWVPELLSELLRHTELFDKRPAPFWLWWCAGALFATACAHCIQRARARRVCAYVAYRREGRVEVTSPKWMVENVIEQAEANRMQRTPYSTFSVLTREALLWRASQKHLAVAVSEASEYQRSLLQHDRVSSTLLVVNG